MGCTKLLNLEVLTAVLLACYLKGTAFFVPAVWWETELCNDNVRLDTASCHPCFLISVRSLAISMSFPPFITFQVWMDLCTVLREHHTAVSTPHLLLSHTEKTSWQEGNYPQLLIRSCQGTKVEQCKDHITHPVRPPLPFTVRVHSFSKPYKNQCL